MADPTRGVIQLHLLDSNTMPLSAGTKLGPYEIVTPIGAGGMGEVYKARDTRLSQADRWIDFPGPPSYDVAPDGRRFLVRVIREQGAEAPLVLVTNWQALLR